MTIAPLAMRVLLDFSGSFPDGRGWTSGLQLAIANVGPAGLHKLSMNRRHSACTALALIAAPFSIHAAEFKFPQHTFTVPDGFEVEWVAGPPLVDRPVSAAFDEQGRLYVTDSSGSNDKVEKQLQEKPHRVVRLEDSDGDGRFDKSVVFADKMMFPEGCLWFDGALYVAAPPSIWKLTDTDGDGRADKREEWFQGKTLTGCANDLHGPFLGPDGWIYWCKGAFAKQTYERPGKPPFVTRAAHIFRGRPDGSGLEPVLTGGMDNPVSVAFTPGGERILTGTFFQNPEAGKRDGLIHAIYGGVYGKVHDVTDDHKKTGDLLPIMTHMGPAAPCSVIRYRSGAFGEEYRDNLFDCLFNLHKVTRHVLQPDGTTFRTDDSDFLVSDNPDFHPTDVLEDADGSLLVIDTGGWYKICCPTSQLWKPDVLGAIYRVRCRGAPGIDHPRGLTLAWASLTPEELAKLLGDPRPAVRDQAIEQISKRGNDAIAALASTFRESPSVEARRNTVWALTRIDTPAARQAVRLGLQDKDGSVRQAAIHSISVWRDASALEPLLALLKSGSAHNRRAAAEALGRLGDKAAVPILLKAAGARPDRVLEHSLIYALIEIGDGEAVRNVLDKVGQASRLGRPGEAGASGLDPKRTDEPPVLTYARRAALIALDQMDGGGLQAEQVTPFLTASNPALRQTASWIVSHHPEWAGALAGYFQKRLAATDLSEADRAELQRLLARFARDGAIQELLAETVCDDEDSPKAARLTALRAMAQSGLKETPSAWADELAHALEDDDADVVRQAVATARSLPAPKQEAEDLADALLEVGRNEQATDDVRLDALAAVPGGLAEVDVALFDFLRANLDASKPVPLRNAAASVLAKAKLAPAQLRALTESLKTIGPLEIAKVLAAFDKTPEEALGLKLLAALKQSKGLNGLHPETLKARLTNFPATVQQQGQELLAILNTDAAQQQAHLGELLSQLKGGDIRRGQAIFNSAKAACATCHAIGYLGGNLGPDLTRIGQVRTERDLIEAIVYPSVSFVRSYEPIVLATKSGDEHSGVLRKDAPDEVVLGTGPNVEVRLARSDIVEMRPGTVSVMPGGLEEQLTRQELADLIAFLKATRW
jgi:putative membrane-bound dehydrogenase-like protein